MRVSGGGHFKQKSIKSKFVSISLRDKLIFLFVGTLFVELLLFGCVMSFYLYINAKKNVSDNIDTTVTAVSEVMDQSFLVMENLVLELAASNGVQNWLDDSHYYDRENSEFYLRKTEFSRELNRILIYSNAKKLDVVEYAAVFNDGYLLDYVDVQSVGGNKVQREVYKAYEAAEQETEKYIYSELVMGSENVIFHIRRMRSDFERDVPLIIMVATNERDIASQYENLVQNEGEVVYLIDEENKVLSSNKEDEIGSYIDEKITECDTGEVYLNETYMMTSREVENLGKGVRLVHLYPQSLLIKKVLEGIRTYIILGVMLIIICLIAAVVISLKSTGFLNEFIHAMESVRNRNYDIRIKEYKNAEINSLGRAFNEMMDELRELIRNKYESQILLNEMEIRFLQHQMNPHFLFNVLLTIQIKAKRSGNETIYKMVSKLSALLRASIYTNNVDRITVGEELEYTEFYLYLQKMRFEGRFFYKIIVEDEELKKSIIPKFVIEPIVENAVIHGIENIENEGVIRIVLKKMGTDLLVTVQDNGAGFDVKEYFNSLEQAENGSSREKIGLKNVDLRLRHMRDIERYDYEVCKNRIEEILNSTFLDHKVVVAEGESGMLIFVIEYKGSEENAAWFQRRLEKVVSIAKIFQNIRLRIGAGKVVKSAEWGRVGKKQAIRNLSDIYTDNSPVNVKENYTEYIQYWKDENDVESYMRRLYVALRSGMEENKKLCAEEFEEYLKQETRPIEQCRSDTHAIILYLVRKVKSKEKMEKILVPEKALDAVYRSKSKAALAEVMRETCEAISTILEEEQKEGSSLSRKVNSIIERDYRGKISLKDIGKELFVNSSYLSRVYKKETGYTVTDAINSYRIEKAKEILETGEYRVCEVGEMVGIEDPAYFTHVFLKYEGKSPSDFMNR